MSRQVHPMYQHVINAALKIESNLPTKLLNRCGQCLDSISVHWPPISPADAVADVFPTLQRTLVRRTRLMVRYDSVYDGREVETILEPLRLVFMARGWYLIAVSAVHGGLRTFKVDRMVSVVDTREAFTPDPAFSETRYFGSAWRMIPEGRVYPIKLRFSAEVAASVEEVCWPESQATTRLEDGRLIFEAEVDGLRELSSWILGYGEYVEVLAPRELRELVRGRAATALRLAEALDEVGDA